MSKFYDFATHQLRRLYDPYITTPAVLDHTQYFKTTSPFVNQWMALRTEAFQVAANLQQVPRFHELMAEQKDISANDGRDWRVFLLKAYGVEIEANMARCPELAKLIRANPDVISATLSFMAPHKHIPRHRGPFRGILRFYLGLDIPRDEQGRILTTLTINDVVHQIGSGQGILWDDTYPHEVINNSDVTRIALLLDIRRHNLPQGLELLTTALVKVVGRIVRMRKVAQ
jgi:aspartate beta-hydroxylase